jgi:hypothetical protein
MKFNFDSKARADEREKRVPHIAGTSGYPALPDPSDHEKNL